MRGVAATGRTFISSIKQLDDRGRVESVQHLKVVPSNSMTSSLPTITGMYLQWNSDHSNGANYDLWVTITKSRKTNTTFGGQNTISHKIPLQLDNCTRYMVVTPQNDPAGTPIEPGMLCGGVNGMPFGKPVFIENSGEAAPNQFLVQGCRVCGAVRETVKGCL